MTGIVLAGGESRRMGRDKAFLPIGGLPMIEHVLRALRTVTDRIIIVTNSPQSYASYGADVTPDAVPQRGSLIGLYSGLLRSGDDYNFVAACDMPFLNGRLIDFMAGLTGYDVVLPRIDGLVEPLHAVYHRALLPLMEDHIRKGRKMISDLFPGRSIRYVTEAEVDRLDPGRRSFVNLNTLEEYEEVSCSDLECRN